MTWFGDLFKTLKCIPVIWRSVRNEYDGDKVCEPEDSGSSRIPSKYSLVWDRKYGIEHASFTNMFGDGATTVHSVSFPFVEVAMFIVNVFCATTGRDVEHFSCMYEPEFEIDSYGDRNLKAVRGRLLMNEALHTEFLAWVETYKARFDNSNDWKTLLLPEIQDGQQISGYFVDHNCNYTSRRDDPIHDGKFLNLPDDELFDEWLWMINNAGGKVRILHDKWVFEDAADAMMYQLQLR